MDNHNGSKGCPCGLELRLAPGELPPLMPETALALYRSAQEGITNALRHGTARHLELSLARCSESLVLALSDDGEGLAADWQQRPGHHGLRWLAELPPTRTPRIRGEPCARVR
jgi:two-component system sensor histidine kinase UhpB